MRKRAFSSVLVAGCLAVVAVLFLAPGPEAAPQVTPGCKCIPSLSLQPNPFCYCTFLTVSNLIFRKGRCTAESGGGCVAPYTQTCQVTGTATEGHCSVPGFVDAPFSIETGCGFSLGSLIMCGGPPPNTHDLTLDCGPCSH